MPKNRSIFTIAADIILNRGKVEKDSRAVGKALDNIGKKGKKSGKSVAAGFSEISNLMPGVLKDFSSLSKTLTSGALVAAVGALGIEIFKFAEGVNKSRDEVKKFTRESGARLDYLTGRVSGLAKSYDKDLNEVLQATNALSRQMGISFDESLGLVEEGFIRGADRSGELLSNLKEYPTFFKEAGFSAGQLLAIINQQAEQGIFSDKGVDAVKEFLLRVREMPKATKEALKAIGIDGEKMQQQIADGTLSIQEAFVIVSQKLSQLPEDSQIVGQVLADVFGGAGEDAGVSFISSFKDGFPDITDSARTEAQNIQAEFIKSGQKVEEEWAKLFGQDSKLWTQIKTGFNDYLGNLLGVTRILGAELLKIASFGQLDYTGGGGQQVPGGFVGPEAPDQGLPEFLKPGNIQAANVELEKTKRIYTDLAEITSKGIGGQSLGGVTSPGQAPGSLSFSGEKTDSSQTTGEALLLADAFYGVSDAFGAMVSGFAAGENGLEIFWQSFKRFALQMIGQMAAMAAMAALLSIAISAIPGLGAANSLGGIFNIAEGGGSFGSIFNALGGFGIGGGGGGGGSLLGLPAATTITGAGSVGGNKQAIAVDGRIRGEDIYLSNQRYQNNR